MFVNTPEVQKKELEDRKKVYEMEINQIDFQLDKLIMKNGGKQEKDNK